MIVTIDNVKYKVKFKHYNSDKDYKGTKCTIIRISNSNNPEISIEDTVITTNTILKDGENFNKEIGRQLSLKRALHQIGFSKGIRQIFWNAYKVWGKTRF